MDKKMNVCVAGKNNIAVEVLKYLIKNNNGRYNLCVICNENRSEIKYFQKSLAILAENNDIPVVLLDDVYKYEDLIFLSMEFDKIIKPDRFRDARLFNIHFSLLPAYKGLYTSAVPILNGEKYSGVTFHRIDFGIDTGDIIAQRKFEIDKTDTCRDLYQKYLSNSVDLVKSCIEDVLAKNEKSVRQTAEGASYYPLGYIDYNNLKLNLRDVATSVERQVRAYSFREYQMPAFNGIDIISCKVTDIRSEYKPGTIIKENESLVEVSTIDFDVILYKDRFAELFESCKTGDLDKIKKICKVRAHIEVEDDHGWTPLIVATYNNYFDVVRYLITIGANVYAKNYNGTNLLMYAKEAYKQFGDRRLFDLYKDLGLDIFETDEYGLNVVDYIKQDGLTELLQM